PPDLPTRDFLLDARRIGPILQRASIRFVVNNRADIALAAGACGVHLGQRDLPLAQARRILGPNAILGKSVSTPGQALRAEREGADYVAASAVFPTATKPDARAIGLAGLRAIGRGTRLPVIAVGGVTVGSIPLLLRAGADGVAVISAVFGSGTISENIRRLHRALGTGSEVRRRGNSDCQS
ncbi:MAG: thiamine phosphate synthase, partial [candidate division WOR-3 bacterium]